MITAPFNFVPLSEKVFFPDWAEEVSHDVPFEDAQSGVIDITMTAKSPLFVRDHNDEEKFCNHNGTQYIPGPSVKGMVRNVLEIMSFSKIPIDSKTHAKTMSVRDMSNRNELVGTASGCGFLKKDAEGKWIIVDYGRPRTIGYEDIRDKTIHIDNESVSLNFETAEEKYNVVGLYKEILVQKDTKDLIDRNDRKIGTKDIALMSNSGESAYLILTGGIDNKKNEFVFVHSDKGANIENIESVVDKFDKAYFKSESIDGNFWKNNWNEEIGIPIFYKKVNNKIVDIGLSQLFKLAYNYTINNATKQQEKMIDVKINKDEVKKDIALDLAQTIFGAVRKDASSLKGRVQFSHFKINESPSLYRTITTTLGSPNPSFYPQYIQQNCKDNGTLENDKYQTLMDKGARIAGWKRYPLHFNQPKVKSIEPTDSSTTFTPIGTYNGDKFNEFTFTGKVRFHNLKTLELGALVSALTFHNNSEEFLHNIGMAKSLGFGKIQISLDTDQYSEQLQKYELFMNDWTQENIKENWIESVQLKELFSMAYSQLNIDSKLVYLKLDPENRINKFADAKKGKECLPKVSKLFNMQDNYPQSLLTQEVLDNYEEIKREKQVEEEFSRRFKEANSTDNIQIIKNFIQDYPSYESIEILEEKVQRIERSKIEDKHSEVNKKAKLAYETLQKKKSNQKQYAKELDKFLKKWKADKNNKGSEFVLDLIKKLT